jgi:hypothetical protein
MHNTVVMDCSELTTVRQAEGLVCTASGFFIGPTGPVGPGPADKVFTIYLDFASSAITRVYIPPGLSRAPSLAAGGIFTENVGSDLVITGGTNLFINNTTYAFPIGLSATGYMAGGYWRAVPAVRLGGNEITWENSTDNVLNLKSLTPLNFNSAHYTAPTSGVLSGWLGTLTIYYL